MRDRILLLSALLAAAFTAPLSSVAAPGFAGHFGSVFCRSKSCTLIGSRQHTPSWISVRAIIDHPDIGALGQWRVVRTPAPEKSGDTLSIMHTADALRSDPDFAGLVIRCRPNSALQIALVLITPFPPRTHPNISLAVNHATVHFQADVIPPGSMVALPNEAEVLAKGPWQSAKELTVDIQGEGIKIHGIVSLEKLTGAMTYLQANCPQ